MPDLRAVVVVDYQNVHLTGHELFAVRSGGGQEAAGSDGRVYSQGTALTVSLFLGLVVVKFGLGTAAYFWGISDDGGFAEVLIMIAVMIAFQAELVWRRARVLGARTSDKARSGAAS